MAMMMAAVRPVADPAAAAGKIIRPESRKQTESDVQKWNQLQNQILRDCRQVKTPPLFRELITTEISPAEPYAHTAGYCSLVGYFYVTEGDRGELFLQCASHNLEDMRWYIMKRILTHIGRQLELKGRKIEEKNWRYPRNFKNGELTFEENENWIYNAVHDSRKFCFEYVIASLAKLFEAERVYNCALEYLNFMNKCFESPHWDFDRKKMCFVEISDSREHG